MRSISLTQNQFATVDDCEFEYLSQWKWYARRGHNTYYAARGEWQSDRHNNTIIYMHRILMQRHGFATKKIDHKDGNGLNNQLRNLRETTQQGNASNSQLARTNTSGYRGVYWNTSADKWQAYIYVMGKSKYLGVFSSKIEAARVYNVAATKYFGEFANLNIVD